MHVVIVTSWYAEPEELKKGYFVEEQVIALLKRGIKVTVVYPHYLPGTITDRFNPRSGEMEEVTVNGHKTLYVNTSFSVPFFRESGWKMLSGKVLKWLKDQLTNDDQVIVHSHSILIGGVLGRMIAKELVATYVHTEHTLDFVVRKDALKQFEKSSITKVLNESDALFFVSEYQKKLVNEVYGVKNRNQHVVYNMVSESFFENVVKAPQNGKFKMLWIGYHKKVKNVALLLEALTFFENKEDIELNIIGITEEELSIAQYRGVENCVRFHGEVSKYVVKEMLTESHVLISTSLLETFGIAVAESMAVGRPVIITPSGGPQEFVNKKSGVICCFDAKDLHLSILKIKEEYGMYDPVELSEYCKKMFSEAEFTTRLIDLYHKTLKDE